MEQNKELVEIHERLARIEHKLNELQKEPADTLPGYVQFIIGFAVVFVILLIVYFIPIVTKILPL